MEAWIAEALKFVATSFVVVIGWIVVSDQQEARELAKSRYARLYALRDELKKIEVEALKYHMGSFDRIISRSLMRSIKSLSDELSHLKECGCVGVGTMNDVASFRRSVTLKNCDSQLNFVRQSADSELVVEIEASVATLDRQLLRIANHVATSPRTLRASLWATVKRRI